MSQDLYIDTENYQKYFKYKIYDCFKPVDLEQTRNYLEFLTTNDSKQSSQYVSEEDVSPELYSYLTSDVETKLPAHVNQQKLLQFDSNFESGNLDSVYLASQNEYNLLCKVDTNTKGHTYWFYFKVLNWVPKAKATFNILNVARDLLPFYNRGMNIWTRTESANGLFKTDWDCSANNSVEVLSFSENDIVRSKSSKKEYACGRYYNTLKFRCTFPEIQTLGAGPSGDGADDSVTEAEVGPDGKGESGNVFCFAYALPYTYSDLLTDLENSKKFLLSNGGIIVNELKSAPKKSKPKAKKQQKADLKSSANNLQVISRKDSSLNRQILTKQQIATMVMRKQAINIAKEKMGQFEIQLLKAESETNQNQVSHSNLDNRVSCKLLEIHTEYLYYKQEIVS